MSSRLILIFAALFMFTAIALGAFGAHAWQATLENHDNTDIFATASQYHFYHALALLGIGIYANIKPSIKILFVPILIIFGTSIFSGSLYILALSNIKWLGAITPVGGVLLLTAWVLFASSLIKQKHNND